MLQPFFVLQVGALVVKDVKPYEFMKLRLLNGGHSCLSYISVLCGYNYVDDAMADPLISGVCQHCCCPSGSYICYRHSVTVII